MLYEPQKFPSIYKDSNELPNLMETIMFRLPCISTLRRRNGKKPKLKEPYLYMRGNVSLRTDS